MSMPEVARATVTIIPNMKGSQQKIAEDLGVSTGDAGEKAGQAFGSRLIGAVGKLGVAAAVTKIVKDSIAEGANLQQSFGGLETLYGDAADQAKAYAYEAAKAGISANDYAEQAVSFGASLKAAFGGDTAKAVEAANTAIMDMTDNAAKMGTPIESIQAAYQGFAKGQYQLLDNLKIGYGGTKGEMERLLADASKLSGVEYNIDNLGDVYEAIHVIQEDLGLTGVAAEEAATTFSGSFGAMKASAKNVLGNLALGKDIMPSLQQLGDSVKTFIVGNLLPMVGNVLSALPEVIANLPAFIAEMLPEIAAGAFDIVVGLANGIVTNIPTFIAGVGKLLASIPQAIMGIDWGSAASTMLNGLSGAIGGIWDSVTSLLSATFGIEMPDWNTVVQDITDLWENVKAGIGDFFKAAFDIIMDDDKTITEKISALWDLVREGIGGLFKAHFDLVIPAFETIVGAISDWWGANVWPSIQDFFKATFGIDIPDWNTIVEPIQQLWENVKAGIANLFSVLFGVDTPSADDIISAIDGLWASVWDGIGGFFKAVFGLEIPTWEEVKESISNFWTDIKTGISGWFKATFNIKLPSPSDIIDKVKGVWEDVKEGVSGFFKKPFGVNPPDPDTVTKKLEEAWKKIKDGIGNFFSWVFSIKPPSLDKVIQDIKDFWGDVVKGIGDFLTLKWIFGEPDEEEVKQQFSGGGRKFDLPDDKVSIDSDAIQEALANANLKLSDIDTSSLDTAKEAVTNAVTAMENSFKNMKMELNTIGTSALGKAKTIVNAAVSAMKHTMNFSWSLPSLHGHLPIISVSMRSASSSDGRTHVSYPELSVSGFRWFAEGGIFNEPTVIGIGDSKGPEAAVPLDQMWRRMSAEFDKHMNGGGATVNNYFTVDGAQDPEAWAMGAARMIKRELRMS